ncbi:hypothetical protein DACRYDRAFT_106843 [Dacryopinax primogenitus]|uniref:BRCA2 OB1 domain-containing protein n=1 Tax=Dacryopinax primogenitus (strain DJM 731) TaxID=1858805 RepID=M5GA30_DACPD|nr:uncharacterized protein DACRYDRAFT_106843 [Dacryopinax primogenitus]EJU02787.1 hypothetical protein DACRYDRAFT_106843 [Dacryopinax primogenitus]
MTTSSLRPETGPYKRPRLSAPTTHDERAVASQATSSGRRPSQGSCSRNNPITRVLSESEQRSRLAAIQAGLAVQAPQPNASSGRPAISPTTSTSLTRPPISDEIRQARLKAIQDTLREDEAMRQSASATETSNVNQSLDQPLAQATEQPSEGYTDHNTTMIFWPQSDVETDPLHDADYDDLPVDIPTSGFHIFSATGGSTAVKPPDERTLQERLKRQRQWEEEDHEGDTPYPRSPSPGMNTNCDAADRTSDHISTSHLDRKGKATAVTAPRTPLSEVKNGALVSPTRTAHTSENEVLRTSVSRENTAPLSLLQSTAPVNPPQTTARQSESAGPSAVPALINPAIRALNYNRHKAPHTPAKATPKKFVTPFKTNHTPASTTPPSAKPQRIVHYGTPSIKQPTQPPALTSQTSGPNHLTNGARRRQISDAVMRNRVFDLEDIRHRQTLLASGIAPEKYDKFELKSRWKIPSALFSVTPQNAVFYLFNINSQNLGAFDAHAQLIRRGCRLATPEWVQNHWSLILWKLAGMARAQPEDFHKHWSYDEVVRQLLYRYEREINRGERPAVRKIQEQDCPASRPMVLTVCEISWSEGQKPEEAGKKHLNFVLTDGWYKIRAAADECLGKAVNMAKIRIGTKIAMSGIKLEAAKEGKEVLKALDNTQLKLTGNSTSIARWYTKLGFSPVPFVPTIASLTADGGNVVMLHIVVTKLFEIGFIDSQVEGQPRPVPRCQKEEDAALDAWMKKCEKDQAELCKEFEDNLNKLEGLLERLNRQAGYQQLSRDHLPAWAEDTLEELLEADDYRPLLQERSRQDIIYLATAAQMKLDHDQTNARQLIERAMEQRHEPRQVRNFQVAWIEDARTCNRIPMRTGQLTVWDALSLDLHERMQYVVTNLVPTQKSSWRKPDMESEVFLQTTRGTRWTPLT